MTPKRFAAALALSVLSNPAWAVEDPACAPGDLAPVDAWLAEHPWKVGRTGPEVLVAANCKAWPLDPSVTIVAAAYGRGTVGADGEVDDEHFGDKNFVVALVQPHDGKLRNVFAGSVRDDVGWAVKAGSLHIDAAPYDLARGVRAFGVDVSFNIHTPRCTDAGAGPVRTLFVQDGASLRPVLVGLPLVSWRLLNDPYCGLHALPDFDIPLTGSTIRTLSLARHSTQGFADLVVTSEIHSVHPEPLRRKRFVLRYDGSTYRSVGVDLWTDFISSEPEPDAAPRSR